MPTEKKNREAPLSAIVLLVKDHMDHGVGCTDVALDVKERVAWAWSAVKKSPAAKRGAIKLLSLDVAAGSVNGSTTSKFAEWLGQASRATGRVLPALAQSWDSDAPKTLRGNLTAKLGTFEKTRRKSVSSVRSSGRKSVSSVGSQSLPDSDTDSDMEGPTVEEACSLPMLSLTGAKRAAQAMLVASVFATELSDKERVPVLVLGRPPGHHATCEHHLALDAPKFSSPGGNLEGASLGGGCFYPSCWVGAVHALREGLSQRLAYIDVDAHKPDGVWKEVDHLSKLSSEDREDVLNGKPDACQGMLFASVHVSGFPNPGTRHWKSTTCTIPKSQRRAFDVRVLEELLPEGVAAPEGVATETLKNKVVLQAFQRWQVALLEDLRKLKPNGLFVGLGFDLHKDEKEIMDKQVGLGIEAQHYCKLIRRIPSTALQGPVVLTLEGGYTKAAVVEGIRGSLAGLEELAKRRGNRTFSVRAQGSRTLSGKGLQSKVLRSKVLSRSAARRPGTRAAGSSQRLVHKILKLQKKKRASNQAEPAKRQKLCEPVKRRSFCALCTVP